MADKLDEIFRNERQSFEEKMGKPWPLVKYGMMTDDKFLEKAQHFFLMEDTSGKFHTLAEFKAAVESTQKQREGKYVVLYTTNPVQQDAYIQQAQAKGYCVVRMETLVDAAFINKYMENEMERYAIYQGRRGHSR